MNENEIAENAGDVVTEIVEHAIEGAEIQTEILIDALEDANERAEHAQEVAAEIAAAAMENERAREVEGLKTEFYGWRNDLAEQLVTLQTGMENLASQLQNLSLLTPPPLVVEAPIVTEIPEATQEVMSPLSAAVEDLPEVEAQPEAPQRKRRRWI